MATSDKRRRGNRTKYLPSPDEIEQRAAEVRSRWGEADYQSKCRPEWKRVDFDLREISTVIHP